MRILNSDKRKQNILHNSCSRKHLSYLALTINQLISLLLHKQRKQKRNNNKQIFKKEICWVGCEAGKLSSEMVDVWQSHNKLKIDPVLGSAG